MTRRSRLAVLFSLVLIPLLLLGLTSLRASAEDVLLPVTHQRYNFRDGPLTSSPDGRISFSDYRNPSSPICSTSTSNAANVSTDCEGVAPHNETSIAVNPNNSKNMIGSANDYQIFVSSGGTAVETVYSRAHVTFDGGKTWTTYPVPFNGYIGTGDPAVSFDADGTAYLATLGFVFGQRSPTFTNPDILVSRSTDGGKTWSAASRIAAGSGSAGSVGTFNDKEFLTAWGHGNAIVTWTVFNDGVGGSYISSPIYASVTHDGGRTWTRGVEISGSAPFCIGAQGGNACNQSQASIPVVAADGSIYVAFLNTAEMNSGRDQYLVVKVDPQSGKRVAGPYKVGGVFDGFKDYPINVDGRQTYQDSQFRTWAAGNIASDPKDSQHLAVVWSDMRNSTLPAPADPYSAKTNSDVIVSQSTDGGQTWSAPIALRSAGDQFMPWAAYGDNGLLSIGYFDRSYDAANHEYGFTRATEVNAGSLKFATQQVTTTLSDPTKNDRWFSGRSPNTAFPHPTTFLGDYSGIAALPGGGVVSLWTDMRETVNALGRSGKGEDAYFAASQ